MNDTVYWAGLTIELPEKTPSLRLAFSSFSPAPPQGNSSYVTKETLKRYASQLSKAHILKSLGFKTLSRGKEERKSLKKKDMKTRAGSEYWKQGLWIHGERRDTLKMPRAYEDSTPPPGFAQVLWLRPRRWEGRWEGKTNWKMHKLSQISIFRRQMIYNIG